MSYTPENQLMEEKLIAAANALGQVCEPIKTRLLANSREWNEEHLAMLNALLHDLINMQIRLYNLSEEMR